ncbi:MAG TPA: ribonuclease R [Cyclobacteriaceae bacterium]
MSKNKRKKIRSKRGRIVNLEASLLDFLNSNIEKSFSIRQLDKAMDANTKHEKLILKNTILDLAEEGKIRRLKNDHFMSIEETDDHVGVVDHVNAKFAYVVVKELENDIWVSSRNLNGAIHGDEVQARITKQTRSGKNPEGKVIKTVRRSRDTLVGKVELSPSFAFVIPDSRNIYFDVFVYPEKTLNAKNNDKVIVKIKKWATSGRNPEGEIISVLGPAGDNEAEIHAIMAEFELPFEFPEKVEQAAQKIRSGFTKQQIRHRKDFREVCTFTIDPDDAKDFDDALSVKFLEDGSYEIGVHIADVTHYVKPDTLLEEEAYNRATSVYLVDRTIPMLPERLSNDLCSLRPREDRLTFAAVFVLSAHGTVISEWFGRTIIHSDHRFSYEEAQAIIESEEGPYSRELTVLNNLAKKIRDKRFKSGAINFETVEVKFQLNDRGIPLGIIPKVRKDAHKLIEEFMLLANKHVAEFIFRKNDGEKTFVYRTHDDPDSEKLENFAGFATRFGHKLDLLSDISRSLNQLLSKIEGKPEQNVLESLAVRSMAKAKYTTTPDKHFGLAFEHYTHFTSPIRRYPDMMVHRALQHYLDGGKSLNKNEYEDRCIHSSEREKRASDAERASIKFKQVEFMELQEETDFSGIVSGVTEWGIFVEIVDFKVEGMVRLADMKDDFYQYDDKNYRIVGRNNKRMITLGDKVKVRVVKTDIDRRTIDLEFITDDES